ncbi:unnamed protein product [Amoebophrya sp. A25]|nr:unnamed protein product [Amoebophrya sp. A25]|eukprot:GSA25T00008637001.1
MPSVSIRLRGPRRRKANSKRSWRKHLRGLCVILRVRTRTQSRSRRSE